MKMHGLTNPKHKSIFISITHNAQSRAFVGADRVHNAVQNIQNEQNEIEKNIYTHFLFNLGISGRVLHWRTLQKYSYELSETVAWSLWVVFSMTGMGNTINKAPPSKWATEFQTGQLAERKESRSSNVTMVMHMFQSCLLWIQYKISDVLTRYCNSVSLSPCEGVWDWGDSIFYLNPNYTTLQFKKQPHFSLTYFTEESNDNKNCDSDITDNPETLYQTYVCLLSWNSSVWSTSSDMLMANISP